MRCKLGVAAACKRLQDVWSTDLALVYALFYAWAAASGGELPAPLASAATGVTADGFTANWTASAGATGYFLEVYAFLGVPPTATSEGFDGYPDVTPAGWTVTNRTADAAYKSGGASAPSIKLQETGHAVTTPPYPAAVTNFSFWCRGYSVSNSALCLEACAGTAWDTLETVAVSNSAQVITFPLDATSGYQRFRLVYAKDKGNVAVDDVAAAYGDAARAFAVSNQSVGNVTSQVITNLTPGVYYYSVHATDGNQLSAESNVIVVDTAAAPVPPAIAPVGPQTARVGETLTFLLSITPTDGDIVTATNAWVETDVGGVWGLSGGVFSYVPAAEDAGERRFAFSAVDKDGVCAAVAATVTVRRAQLMAVPMTAAQGVYLQDFNALPTNGMDNVWDNAAEPLPAWHAYVNASAVVSQRTGTGSGTSGGLYSFGADQSPDRSLGSLASAGNTCRYGVAFTNMTGLAVTNLAVSFTAEQWRAANGATNALVFEYCLTNRVVPLNQGIWCRVNALCFNSPLVTNAAQPYGAAYAAASRSAALARPVWPGGVVLLRWSDLDDVGNDHALGVDDLRVAWTAGETADAIPVGRAGVAERFDEVAWAAGAELPFLWRSEVRADLPRVSGTYPEADAHVMNLHASSVFTAAGSYLFAAGTAGDYAVGGLLDASGAKSVTVSARFRNAAGVSVRQWWVRYSAEKYRNGLTGCSVRLLTSTDGETWLAAGAPESFPADADTNGCAPQGCPSETREVERVAAFAEPVEPGGSFYLAWQYAVTEGEATADAQALGMDDVWVVPVLSDRFVFILR